MTLIESARNSVGLVTKHADLILVFAVIAVIALMIVPMPTPLVDMLISLNLGVSFVIMMMSLYTPSVLGFSSFPTVLLFTTLFRLGLNICTTRLILLQADAGNHAGEPAALSSRPDGVAFIELAGKLADRTTSS